MIVLGDDDDDDDDDDDEDDTTTSCVDVDVEDKGFTIADEANEHNASHVVSSRAAAAASSSCSSDSTAICLFIVVVASFSCSALLERMLSVTFSLPVLGLLGLGEESLLSLDFKCDNILCGIDYYAVVTTFCVDV